MKKIPHKGEVYPKVEMEGLSTPKIAFAQSRVGPRSSNSRAVMRKRWPRPIFKKNRLSKSRLYFSEGNRASVLVKAIAHAILFTKTEARFLSLS